VRLDGVFGNEKLRSNLAIAEAPGDEGEDFELASGDAEGLLARRVGRKGFGDGGIRRDNQMPKAAKRTATSAL
jgi:hypothetical protein